jgi:hypothetical protein
METKRYHELEYDRTTGLERQRHYQAWRQLTRNDAVTLSDARTAANKRGPLSR